MTTFAGTIEVLTSTNESIGLPGLALNTDVVPVIVGALHGVDGLQSVTPEPRPTGRTPDAQWSGLDAQDQIVTVLLWNTEENEA